MAHTSAAHVPNLACRVYFPSFTEERGARGIERRWGIEIGGGGVTQVFIILWLLRPLKTV